VTGRTLNTRTRLLQCGGCEKVIHVQVLHHLLLLQLQVQTFIYLHDKSPWYHSLTDCHSSLYATSNRGRGAVHSPCTTVSWCTYLSWWIWSGSMEIPILVTAAASIWEAVDDTMRMAHSCLCIGKTVKYIYVEVSFSWQPSFFLATTHWLNLECLMSLHWLPWSCFHLANMRFHCNGAVSLTSKPTS